MQKFKLCYPIMDKKIENFIENVRHLNKEQDVMYELRIDSLLNGGASIEDICESLPIIKKISKDKKLIVTIRTKNEGGEIHLSSRKYKEYITYLFECKNIDYIDIEYNMYKKDKTYYNKLMLTGRKKIILSTHLFDNIYNEKKYRKIFDETLKVRCDIVKFAVMTYTIDEVINFMYASKDHSDILRKCGKGAIFIAMGRCGQISRLYPEYTKSKIVFMAPNGKKASKLGQFDKTTYYKYRKILAKMLKN